MNIPVLSGIIRRRLLVNYRASPAAVERILPSNFRPKITHGHAMVGICLIRLEQVRPKGFPSFMGISSENAAHRFAVEWEDAAGRTLEGVFVSRRDTGSLLNSLAGNRVFPGAHHLSRFTVHDQAGRISIRVETGGSALPLIDIDSEKNPLLPKSSIFESLGEASRFYEAGCIGYSARPNSCTLDGLRLQVSTWKVQPLHVAKVRSSYFDDPLIFPPGQIQFDHALLMRDVVHEWHSEPTMTALPASF